MFCFILFLPHPHPVAHIWKQQKLKHNVSSQLLILQNNLDFQEQLHCEQYEGLGLHKLLLDVVHNGNGVDGDGEGDGDGDGVGDALK